MKKIISHIVIALLSLSLLSGAYSSDVFAKSTVVYASDVATVLGAYTLSSDTTLYMDIDLSLRVLRGSGHDLTIEGDGVLSADYMEGIDDYTQKNNTYVYINNSGDWSQIEVSGNLIIEKDAVLEFEEAGSQDHTATNIKVDGDFISSGEVYIKTYASTGIEAGNVIIKDGILEVNSKNSCLKALDSFELLGGKMSLNIKRSSYVYTLFSPVIKIGAGYNVTSPSEFIFKDVGIYYSASEIKGKTIYGKDGTKPTKVVIEKSSTNTDGIDSDTYNDQQKEDQKKDNQQKDDQKKDDKQVEPKYSNEWINGKWYNADGTQTYAGTLQWKSNATGWWVEDTSGWYPADQWQKIDGIWYYFKPDGYMAANEYYKGYWFNSDGSWDDKYLLSWKSNSTGWWVEDISGWWPSSSWLKIDGYWYYFDASGYMVSNCYIDGWWISADGVCY